MEAQYVTIMTKGRDMKVKWPNGAEHTYRLSLQQSHHWVINSIANFLNTTFMSVEPAADIQIGRRHKTLVALAEHLWGTDLFSQTNIRETLLSTNNQFSKPLADIVVIGIIKGACK